MRLSRLIKPCRVTASLLLALMMLFSMFGCSAAEMAENLLLAESLHNDVGELMEELSDDSLLSDESESVYAGNIPLESGGDPMYISETGLYAESETVSKTIPDEDGYYYAKEDVSLYIYVYGHLPDNFITKDEARALGWESGSVERYLAGAAIGGDVFKNREGLLPKVPGRVYYECDVGTDGENSRGAKRIVFSNDGCIYYTDDHYESFTLLYGKE